MTESVEALKIELEIQKKVVKGYESVLKLNEKELENAEEIIKMYESIVEYSGIELKDAKETLEAKTIVSNMSREELIHAFDRIKELEDENIKLREESNKIKN